MILDPNSTLTSTSFFSDFTPAALTLGSGEMTLVSLLRVVMVTASIPTSATFALTSAVGNVSGWAMEMSSVSKPKSLALGMIQRSLTEKFSVQINVLTPKLYMSVPPTLGF